jgi:hypothetical protein
MAVKPIYEAFASRPKDQALKKPLNLLHTVRTSSNMHRWKSDVENR